MDELYEPPLIETRSVYGIQLQQHRNDVQVRPNDTFNTVITAKGASLPESGNSSKDLDDYPSSIISSSLILSFK